MGELSLIKKFRAHAPGHPWMIVGSGQDCAVLRWKADRDLAYKIDQIVEGTHFVFTGDDAATARQVGWKAMAKACSDIAATGFWPVAATVAVNLQRGSPETIALELYRGIPACCTRYGFALAGGDLSTSTNALSVAVSLLGEGPKGGAWTRAGAKPGDFLVVTGTLGGSRGRKHLDFTPRLQEARAIRKLEPRGVSACIDITDGLSRDLHHICEESGVGSCIEEGFLPVSRDARRMAKQDGRSILSHVLADGEDFELLLALKPRAYARLRKLWNASLNKGEKSGLAPLHYIGRIESRAKGLRIQRLNGKMERLADVGYEHRT